MAPNPMMMAKCPRVPPSPVSMDLTMANGSILRIRPTAIADSMRDKKALSLNTMIKINNMTIPKANAISGKYIHSIP
jgi:hypothetical protein